MSKVYELLSLDVSKHVEKKQNLSYLSWAWAWDQALRKDPEATFQVSTWTKDDGTVQPYMDINGTCMVWVTVKMFGQSKTCMLPVMNAKNEPISLAGRTFKDKYGNEKVEKIDSFNVNTAIMRCMTKCLALFGLGLYIYAGEDLPEVVDEPKAEKKVEEKVEERAEEKPETKAQEKEKDPNIELFADGMIQFVEICTNLKELNSYWKSNIGQIEKLRSYDKELYEKVRAVFTKSKKAFEEGAKE